MSILACWVFTELHLVDRSKPLHNVHSIFDFVCKLVLVSIFLLDLLLVRIDFWYIKLFMTCF